MDENVKITFDNEYRIRALEPTKFKKAEDLEAECGTFSDKISSFSDKITSLVEILESNASRIDSQKLKAIGLRMSVENEAENRNRQKRALETMIKEKRAELDRFTAQYQSLERIESEQKAILEKMSNAQSESSFDRK
jgi:intraflagellar transport protein 20